MIQTNISSDKEIEHFDNLAEDYKATHDRALAIAGGDSDFFYRAKIKLIQENIRQKPNRILDYGGGTGRLSRLLLNAFPNSMIHLFDPSENSVEVAKMELGGTGRFTCSSNPEIDQGLFDLVTCAGVFHHIPRALWQKNMKRITKSMAKNGVIYVFEHNPICPHAQILLYMASLDRDANFLRSGTVTKLFRQSNLHPIKSQFISFFPSNWKIFHPLERYLGWNPLGAQHMSIARKA